MRNGLICLGLAGLLSLPWSGSAQTLEGLESESPMLQEMRDFYGDEAFITIATGSRKPIYKAPAVATVITAAEIKAMGARSLDEVLETVAGLHVVPSALNRLDAIYSIRGIHTGFNPQVLMLMNGVPFTNHFNGGRPTLLRLPVASISRVEVIRGPGSAIYGADAFSGVINVVTKDAFELAGTQTGGRVGSFDSHDLWLQHGRSAGDWDLTFSFEWQKSDGDRRRRVDSDLQSLLDQQFETNASLAPGALDTRYNVLDLHFALERDNWRMRNWYWRQDDAGQGAGALQALDPQGGQTEDVYLVDLAYEKPGIVENWDVHANLNFFYNKSNSRFVLLPPGTRVPIDEDGNLNFNPEKEATLFPDGILGRPGGTARQTGLDLAAIYHGQSNHRWRFGTGVKYQRVTTREMRNFGPGVLDGSQAVVDGSLTDVTGTPFVFLPDSSRTIIYASVQDEWQFAPNWELTTGVRFDHYSDFGETINPRVALVWATLHNLTTKFLYGRAFRAPSFSELLAVNNPVVLGNPGLSPETIDTFELAFDYRPVFDLQIGLNLFAYRANDLIEFVPDDPGAETSTAQNARDQRGHGFEVETIWDATESVRFRANYAWQRAQDRETNLRIPDAPGQQLYLSADWRFLPEWSFYPQVVWVGNRKRADGDLRSNIKDYTLVGMALRRQNILKNVDMALIARNLFDEDAREPSMGIIAGDYPLEGRQFWGEISYRF